MILLLVVSALRPLSNRLTRLDSDGKVGVVLSKL